MTPFWKSGGAVAPIPPPMGENDDILKSYTELIFRQACDDSESSSSVSDSPPSELSTSQARNE